MIPYLLAAVGGYLIGQSQKKDVPQMADGGYMAKGGGIDKLYFVRFDTGDVSTSTTARGGTKEEAIENARKSLKLGDEKVIAVAEINKKNGVPLEMAKGGKVKKKWIQDALGGDEGSLRRTAKRKGLLKGDENLSMTDLKKLQKMGGKTGKRAHLAETLRKFEDGGMFAQDDLRKLISDMDEDEYNNFCAEYEIDCDDANEVENFVYDTKMSEAKQMIEDIKSGKYK
jgi:hypothetical protein